MKKTIMAAVIAGTMLLSGCSGVSQESYNSVVAENESLKSENSSLKSSNNTLESEKSKATAENADLQAKISELEKQNADNEALIEKLQGDNVPLEIVDTIVKTLAHNKDEIYTSQFSEGLQQYIYTDFSVCHIYQISTFLPAASVAKVLKNQEETLDKIQDIGANSYVFLFKSYDKKNIYCYWWADKKSGWVWFNNDIKEEFEKL